MKVLFVESYPQVFMGQQQTMLALLKSAVKRGIVPTVACTAEGIYSKILRDEGFDVITFEYPTSLQVYGGEIYRYGVIKKIQTYAQIIPYVMGIVKKLKALQIDAVYCNDMRGILTVGVAAKLAGIPSITWDKLDKPHGWLDWVQLPLVNRNMVISDSVRVKYPSWQNRFYNKRVVKVHDGAYIDVIDKAINIREELGFTESDIVLAIVGTITERKGHDRLFEALNSLLDTDKNLKVLVVGETADKVVDEEFKNSLLNFDHRNVIKIGYRKDIPSIMKAIDILCVPSRNEGTPLVIMEAMTAYKPVVGSNAGGIAEVIIHNKTGFVFEGSNISLLENYISELINSQEKREQFGHEGRIRVEQYFDRYKQLDIAVDEILELKK
ncbi:glycosyltransferase family 4 protein [Vibrio coralliirubri]|uniref:glycosyltransferase family 4 protein n=1 Tax=Vibrio coralliirubri TaxID=1516159 RepID=UPI000632BE9B|nr:glycosyltransferase family 4 protein [Vibrio coralliirubri]CDU11566.1 hypothetical protein VCR17J2_200005 [Vibrio coralliirubri]